MSRRFCLLLLTLIGAALAANEAAQLVLPGAAPAAPQGAAASPAKAKSGGGGARSAGAKNVKPASSPSVAGLAGRPLMLNGKSGLLQISGDDKTVTIDKLRLAGEGVSDSSQACAVDIVGEAPIQAQSAGRPDGLERFEASVPACPFVFDIVDGAALAPPQITACIFKAADCQTSPGGLWGPDGASLVGDAAKFAKERLEAEKAMGKLVHAIGDRAKDSPDAADLVRDQNGFAGQRDETCRGYDKESVHGYCALRLTQARVALLGARLDEFVKAGAEKAASDKPTKTKPKKGEKQP